MGCLTNYGGPVHIIYLARARWALEAPVLKIYSTHASGGKRFTPPSPSRAGPPLRVAEHLTRQTFLSPSCVRDFNGTEGAYFRQTGASVNACKAGRPLGMMGCQWCHRGPMRGWGRARVLEVSFFPSCSVSASAKVCKVQNRVHPEGL